MKTLLTLLLLPLAAFALDPNQPVVRVDGGNNIIEKRQSIPDRFKRQDGSTTVNYQNAGDTMWAADGWRQAVITPTQQVVTNLLPDDRQLAINMWRMTATNYFGANSHLNTNTTEASIKAAVKAKLASGEMTPEAVSMLKAVYDELRSFWSGHLSGLPYDDPTKYITTNTVQVWSVSP